MIPQEQPQPGTHCVVEICQRDATVYVDISDGAALDGETAVPMCDDHAAHWRSGGE